jgi:DNA-binding response OmpR family regulator
MIANFRRRTITRGQVSVKFSPQQFLIIACLLAARAPVSNEELMYLLYGDDPGGGPESLSAIRVQIHLMRHGDKRGGSRYGSRLDPLGIEVVSVFSHNNTGYRAVAGACDEY